MAGFCYYLSFISLAGICGDSSFLYLQHYFLCLFLSYYSVFISSISAQHPHKGGATYSSSKAALESFSKVVAMEYSHRRIRSNVVSPAMVKTPLYEKAAEDASHESMQAHVDKYPLGIGDPEDVANAIIYLLSDASRWVTGTKIVLDGGCLLGY